jgi:hypothetical protein
LGGTADAVVTEPLAADFASGAVEVSGTLPAG